MKIGVVGGGVGGLAAGWDFARAGHEVTVWEATPRLGGLAAAIPVSGTLLEGAYHHIFKSDQPIINLIDEVGLTSTLHWLDSKMGFFCNGKIHPFGTPIDLLTYKPLSLLDRLRFGASVFYFQKLNNWQHLENIGVEDWVVKWCGRRVYDLVWKPLLKLKFGEYYNEISAAWLWGRINPRSKSRSGGKEQLGYMEGSFQVFFNKLAEKIKEHGGDVQLQNTVTNISPAENTKYTVKTVKDESQQFDRILLTVPTTQLASIVPAFPEEYKKELKQFRYLGAVMLILVLKRNLSDIYWLNISDPEIKFGGVIEQTNFLEPSHYNNNHVVYFFNYLPQDHRYFQLEPKELLDEYMTSIKKIYPGFSTGDVLDTVKFMVAHATPVYTHNYSRIKLKNTTPFPGMYIANTTHIYPEDRNMSNSIKVARDTARLMLESGS